MNETDKLEKGKRIRSARKSAGLTQPELAEKCGVSQQLISKLERGLIDGSFIEPHIALHTGVSAYWLSAGEGDKDDFVGSDDERNLIKAFRYGSRELRDYLRTIGNAEAPQKTGQ